MKLKRNKEKEFETLKKSHKKQIAIGAVAICVIGGALTFATSRAKYRVTQDIPLVRGTVNYKAYDFKIMAMYKQNDAGTYEEITDRIPGSDYTINTSKSYCTIDNVSHDEKVVLKTKNAKHNFENLIKNDKCYIYFDKVKITNSSDIIKYSKINTSTVNYSTIVTTDEGIFTAPDGMYGGISYYWRGAATTNHLIFANKCWRIVRINGDGSIRIIYNGGVLSGNTCTGNGTNTAESIAVANQVFNASKDNSSYVGWTYTLNNQRPADNATGDSSNAKTQTEAWCNSNIGNNATYAAKVADGKFCNDRNVDSAPSSWGSGYITTWSATGTSFAYAGPKRLYDLYAPTLGYSALDTYTLKVGAITADEAYLAGGKNAKNTSYYLYNGQSYWTISPYNWNNGFKNVSVFYVNSSGQLTTTTRATLRLVYVQLSI